MLPSLSRVSTFRPFRRPNTLTLAIQSVLLIIGVSTVAFFIKTKPNNSFPTKSDSKLQPTVLDRVNGQTNSLNTTTSLIQSPYESALVDKVGKAIIKGPRG
uniref:Uncharacterized protein n=1 Tax=Timspurckia oligopyrenoides TaxID=708627 RepID=A0A7S1ES19_9RHOD|mmetsp:Transcript_399/g.733  ORF Transcript_399/g.733 Transcript_399/m.733 type:complete len:101 (+) Transcript_399:148-450(+)